MSMVNLFDPDLVASTLRICVPVLLAALGAIVTMRAGIYNIALEGQMIAGAFAAVAVTSWTGSLLLGIVGGVVAGTLASGVLALVVIRFGANAIVASIAINLLAAGMTGFLLRRLFGVEGTYRPQGMTGLPAVTIPLLEDVPVLGPALSGQTPLVYVALLLVFVTWVLLFRTPLGLEIRAVGELPAAMRTAGRSPARIQTAAVLYSGALCGLAGAHLALGYASEFTVGMTAGRGFTGFSAAIFGLLTPGWTLVAALVFGLAEAIGLRVQLSGVGLPTSIVQMVPYLLALLAIGTSGFVRTRRRGAVKRQEVVD